MKKLSGLLLLCCLCFVSTDLLAQKKKKNSEKQQVETEEKIEEIRDVQDQEISGNGGRSYYATPQKKFDTTAVPMDALTVEIQQLLKDLDVIATAIEVIRAGVLTRIAENTSTEMKEFYDRFSASLNDKEVTGFYNNLFIRLYRKYFNIDDIRALSSFYKTETGKKSLSVMSGLMQESMAEGSKFGEYWGEKVYVEMKAKK